MKKLLIISGGGVFGYIPASFLAGYDKEGNIQPKIDFISGTSVGGILSLMYARGYEYGQAKQAFVDNVNAVFKKHWYDVIPIWGPRHSRSRLETELKKHLDIDFGLLTPHVIIPTLDFIEMRPKVFDNMIRDEDCNWKAWEIATATSAAPTYFAPFECNKHALIDGGLMENIPVITALTAIKKSLGIDFRDVNVFIIGTGFKKQQSTKPSAMSGWGALNWAKPLVDMLTNANETSSLYWARQLPLADITYYNPVVLENKWSMDDPSLLKKMEPLIQAHQDDFNYKFKRWLDK